jgi:hypothetical protein
MLVKSITHILQYYTYHRQLTYAKNSIIIISSSMFVIRQDYHVLKIWLSSYSTYSLHNHNKVIINVGHMIKLSCSQIWLSSYSTYLLHNHNKIIINVGQMIKLSYFQNMVIIIFNLFIMIHDHNKIIINVGHMIKTCESIILNHRWVDIELILDKNYGHD